MSLQSLSLQFSAVKNIHFTETTDKIAKKEIWFKGRAIKFTSFRAAEAKWRDQISHTAGDETEVPIYFASRN